MAGDRGSPAPALRADAPDASPPSEPGGGVWPGLFCASSPSGRLSPNLSLVPASSSCSVRWQRQLRCRDLGCRTAVTVLLAPQGDARRQRHHVQGISRLLPGDLGSAAQTESRKVFGVHLVYRGRVRQARHEAVDVLGWISAGPGAGGRCCNSGQEFARNCLAVTESWVPALSLRDSASPFGSRSSPHRNAMRRRWTRSRGGAV